MSGYTRPRFELQLADRKLHLGIETKIMGVLNVTPDSFSDGGRFLDPALAEQRALCMEAEGAHLIDIGGESSRPGSKPVSDREEIRRVSPVLKRLSKRIQIPVSIDTYKYDVASAALDEGAVLVNDTRALGGDKRMAKLIAKRKAGVVLMHMRGIPESMQKNPSYKDVLKEISAYLKKAVRHARDAGIEASRILADPGFGFGKTAEQNAQMLFNFDCFHKLNVPLVAGLSRKSFIGSFSGINDPVDRLYGSLAAAAAAIERGAHVLRVHDVAAHRQASLVMDKGRTLT